MKIPSIKKHVLVMSGALAFVLAGSVLWLSGYFFDQFSRDIANRNHSLCRALADHTGYILSRPVEELSRLIRLIETPPFDTPQVIQDEIDDILKFNPFFELIQLMDDTGRISHVAPFSPDHIGLDMSNHPFFEDAASKRRPVWSAGFISSQTGAITATVSIPFSKGVVTAQLNLEHLSSALRVSAIGRGGFAAVTDARGGVIAHSDESVVKKNMNIAGMISVQQGLKGQEGSWNETWGDREGLTSVAVIEHSNWVVIIFQPDSVARAVVKRMERLGLVMVAATFFLILAGQYLILRKLTTPLDKLETQIKTVARGESHCEIHPDFQELVPLVDSFNKMAKRIRQRELALKNSEAKYKAIFEGAKEGILLIAEDGSRILFANQSMVKLLAPSGETLQNRCLGQFCPGTNEVSADSVIRALAANRNKTYERVPLSVAGGDIRTMEVSASMVKLDDTPAIAAFFNDITHKLEMEAEKENLERQLLQTQKIEAIGVLAGGIAHDFNNILFPILGHAEMLADDLPPQSTQYQSALEIKTASLRARDLVSQILAFSRQSEKQIIPIRLQPIVKEAVKLLRSSFPSTIDISINIDNECGSVMADPTEIHQVVMNLTTNAFHAMQKSGGRLAIRLKQEEPSANVLAIWGLAPGSYAVLTVEDSGDGISPDILDRIFDPYFTTKERGKGTGLGLSVVRGIVKNSNGNVRVDSRPGEGTCVTVYLPVIDTGTDLKEQTPVEIDPGGTEHILLVDDESSVANMEKIMLERLGYDVTAVTDSRKAALLFGSRPDRFDLIISDMTMPGMTGIQLQEAIKAVRPDIPFIICSGFSDKIDNGSSGLLDIQGYLEKPVMKSEMAKIVRAVLDKAAATDAIKDSR